MLYLEPVIVDDPFIGEIKGREIYDVTTMVRRVYDMSGAECALGYRDLLQEEINKKTWRSAAALDLLQLCERQVEDARCLSSTSTQTNATPTPKATAELA